jgi:hypothetical protein
MSQLLILTLILIFAACGNKSAKQNAPFMDQMPETGEIEIQGKYLHIFPSFSKVDGSSGKDLSSLDGVCTSDALSLGLHGKYKAMVNTSNRRACQSADCFKKGAAENRDWVLIPEMEYRLPDGKTLIGETNESGIFTFPLKNPLSSSSLKLWTGFADYWTTPYYSFESCAQMTNQRETGFVGDASSVSADLLKESKLKSCKAKLSVICVEQISH